MKYALWTVQLLLAALFLFAGGFKLVAPIAEMTQQMAMPGWFLRFIGSAEVLGAVGLILPSALRVLPKLTALAAAGLVVIMIGATAVTYKTMGGPITLFPAITGVLAAFVAYGRWKMAPVEARGTARAAAAR
ncbi:MAG TPA: DoxX family protein [Terriglobales bacterium]|nr:DoxX family protein [Terriglobales bacterium]